MLKKTIKFTDYNGEEKSQDFYFNLNKAELLEMELSAEGGLENTINRLILQSYGEKTIDGRFEKSHELSKKFSETAAYPELFTELATDADAASAFVNGIIPTV